MTIEIPSSFLNDEFTIDNSSLDLFSFCPRKFALRTAFALRSQQDSPYTSFGSAFHAGLKSYYAGNNEHDCLKAFVERALADKSTLEITKVEALDSKIEKSEYSIEFGVELFLQYMNVYPLEKEIFRPMVSEGVPYLEIGFSIDTNEGVVIGVMDQVAELTDGVGGIAIIEHKTTSKVLDDKYFQNYNPNNQISMYLIACRELIGVEAKCCIINAIRVKDYKRAKEKSEQDQRLFSRRITSRTRESLDDRIKQMESILRIIRSLFETNDLSSFPMNAPSACYRYGMCEYLPICTARSESVARHFMENSFIQEKWVPYEVLGQEKGIEIKPENLVHLKV